MHWQRLQAQLNPNENEPIEQSFSFKEKYGKVNKIITAKKNSAGNFYGIPHELMLHILSFLAAQGLAKVAEVSRFFRSVAEDDSLWLPILKEAFTKIPKPDNQSAKNFFQQLKYRTHLKSLLIEKYPEIVLKTPLPQSTKFKKGLFASYDKKMKRICYESNEKELTKHFEENKLQGPNSTDEAEIRKMLSVI